MPSDPHSFSIRVQQLNGVWETLGADGRRGIVPEGLNLTWNSWGADSASFNLNRLPQDWPLDLRTWSPVQIEVAGVPVWDGRIKETPLQGQTINVQCEGWQYHLDDDVYQWSYLQSDVTAFQDARSFAVANLASNVAAGDVTVGDGVILLAFRTGYVTVANNACAVVLDAGPGCVFRRVVATVDSSNNSSIAQFFILANNTADWTSGATTLAGPIVNNAGASFTATGTIAGGARYITLIHLTASAGGTYSADAWFRVKTVQCFAQTAYESGGVSALTADKVVQDDLSRTVFLQDASLVQAGTFTIPALAPGGSQSFREWINSANAYENFEARVAYGPKLVFGPRAAAPIYEVGVWPGSDFQDTSANSGDDIVNKAIVQGTGPDGSAFSSIFTGSNTLADRWRFFKSQILQASNPLTTAVASRLASLYLAAHQTTPFRGDLVIVGSGGLRRVTGDPVHPAHVQVGQLVRLTHLIDPDTGGLGRAGRIATLSYDHASLTSTISLDENRAGFDALLARLAVVVGTGKPPG